MDLDKVVMNTPGYVGADMNALIDEALISALDRYALFSSICKKNVLNLFQCFFCQFKQTARNNKLESERTR